VKGRLTTTPIAEEGSENAPFSTIIFSVMEEWKKEL
jgi:hypothetical protein